MIDILCVCIFTKYIRTQTFSFIKSFHKYDSFQNDRIEYIYYYFILHYMCFCI